MEMSSFYSQISSSFLLVKVVLVMAFIFWQYLPELFYLKAFLNSLSLVYIDYDGIIISQFFMNTLLLENIKSYKINDLLIK
uniref:Uncharacterized protein n=1 Tax=Anguilla anguilla TaxID=7936 RepID=A0A0E9WQZ0_ANGAN